MYQRRVDYLRLLRQALMITEISHLDGAGREQLRVSRLAMDVAGSQTDFSLEPKFLEAKAGKVYHGPVYFRKESEPYMTIAMAGSGRGGGVTVAEVNLKFIWDVVSQIKIGKAGPAFVLDGQGVVIAHPDISLVLQKTTFAGLDQVKPALAGAPVPGESREQVTIARDLKGRRVMTVYATIAPLKWSVFVEQPLGEAFETLYASIQRTIGLLVLGVLLAVAASLFLARRMVTPIQALRVGAARIGAGELDQRIDVRTGDELEALGDQFNSMAAQLKESYAVLERRTLHFHDMLEEHTRGNYLGSLEHRRRIGYRTLLIAPLLREGLAIGVIVMRRMEVKPFTDKQIALLQTFADQAVIAIENVRLFQELQARTRELARSVDELKALGEVGRAVSSTLDLETVLATIVSRANQLSGTDAGAIYEYDEEAAVFHLRATQNLDAEFVELLRAT